MAGGVITQIILLRNAYGRCADCWGSALQQQRILHISEPPALHPLPIFRFLSYIVSPTLLVYCVPPPCALIRNSCASLADKSLSSSSMTTQLDRIHLPPSCSISLFCCFLALNIRVPKLSYSMSSSNPNHGLASLLSFFRFTCFTSSFICMRAFSALLSFPLCLNQQKYCVTNIGQCT